MVKCRVSTQRSYEIIFNFKRYKRNDYHSPVNIKSHINDKINSIKTLKSRYYLKY